MSEAIDGEINVNKISEVIIDTISTSLDKKESVGNSSFTSLTKEHKEWKNDQGTSDVNKTKHVSLSNINQDKTGSLQPTDNPVTMMKVKSRVVLFVIICLVILLSQLPIILYYTDPPPDKNVSMFHDLNFKTCSKEFMLVSNVIINIK